jgi:hypothetical protein
VRSGQIALIVRKRAGSSRSCSIRFFVTLARRAFKTFDPTPTMLHSTEEVQSMFRNSKHLIAVLVAVSLCEACSLEAGEETHDAPMVGGIDGKLHTVKPQGVSHQGVSHQGVSHQGVSHQGVSHQGLYLTGIELSGLQLAGLPFTNVQLNGTVFSGMREELPVSGTDFIGAETSGILSNGEQINIRFDNIETTSDPDILHYTISYFTDGWKNLCGTDANNNIITALPLLGEWDESQGTETGGDYIDDPSVFTFGCASAVLAKCVEFGYKPWKTVIEQNGPEQHVVSLRHYHQACLRMMREDVCGDGMPHTVDGTSIDLFDNHDVQVNDLTVVWPLEAEWTSEGASCMLHARYTSAGQAGADATQAYVEQHCPEVISTAALASCGTSSSTYSTSVGFNVDPAVRALLRNESVAPPSP